MPPTPSRHAAPDRPAGIPARRGRLVAAALLAALPLAGCGTPPELRAAPTAPPTRTAAPAPTGTPTLAPTPPPATGLPGAGAPTADPGLVAVRCPDGPSGRRVIDLVRGRGGVLPRDARVRVRTGPLCAGDWHYTVLDVTGHEDLHVVTEGRPGAPRLVTAGTDVCTAEVRAAGPPGIRTLVCDGGSVGVPGA